MAEAAKPGVEHRLGPYNAIFRFYEEGKARRYNILFAVNTAVFGILKIVPDSKLGVLAAQDVGQFAFGMALFTLVMGFDLWMFGTKMRKAGDPGAALLDGLFAIPGRLVLVMLCGLMAGGWLAVARGAALLPPAAAALAPPVPQFGLFNPGIKG